MRPAPKRGRMTRPVRRPCAVCQRDEIHVGLACLSCGALTALAPLYAHDVSNGAAARKSSAAKRKAGRTVTKEAV